jgi:uncharacterized membrane protein YkvA (DUF1232 family)
MTPKWFAALQEKAKQLQSEVMGLYFAYKNPATPWYARILAALVVAYALCPIDLIPDFIPVLGYLDDLVLVPGGVWLAIKLIPADIMADSRSQAVVYMKQKPVKGWFAIIIILIWAVLLFFIGRWVWSFVKK